MPRRLLALALLSALASGAEAADRWIEVKSPNLTVVSNAGDGRARGTAWELEQARAAFAKLWPWATLATGKPTVVIAAKDETTLKRWLPTYWETKGGVRPASTSAHGADRQYLLLRLDATSTDSQQVTQYFTLYRAYVSALLSASLPRPLPSWLHIGLSEVYGNTSVQDKEVQVGRVVPWHLRQFNEGARIPLSAILSADRGTKLVMKEDERSRFDAQCWVLVHYLMYGDERVHAKELDRFVQLWLAGRSQDVAWKESLPAVATLDESLTRYATRQLFSYGRLLVDVNLERERLPVRPLVPAETASLQAAVHVAMGRTAEAQTAIQEARTADPKSPLSYDAEGLLADRERDEARAAQAYGQAAELGSSSAYTYYRAAHLAWKPPSDPETLATIRKRLERAIELNGSYAPAHAYLAEVMVQQGEAKAALPEAQRAIAIEPGDANNQITLARVYHGLDDSASARAAAGRALDLADNEYERSNAQRFLSFLDEEAAHRQRNAAQEAAQARAAACQGGDAATCAQLVPELERGCAEGKAAACVFAAWLFDGGRGVATDAVRASGFLERACGAGDRQACLHQAWKQATGNGIPKDEARAMAAFGSLCDEKVYEACTQLAMLYVRKPATSDRARARKLLAEACEGGDSQACALAKSIPR